MLDSKTEKSFMSDHIAFRINEYGFTEQIPKNPISILKEPLKSIQKPKIIKTNACQGCIARQIDQREHQRYGLCLYNDENYIV